MSTRVVYWSATWMEDAGGAFGATRSGSLGKFDSEYKAKTACQKADDEQFARYKQSPHLMTWHAATRKGLGHDLTAYPVTIGNAGYDGRIYFVDLVELVIE